jgi:hypothetical protein
VGILGLGFGIGEDGAGANSAGALMVTNGGLPFLSFGGAARVGDVDEPALVLASAATLSGSLFVGFEAATGTITVGASQTPGAVSADASDTFDAIQTNWAGEDLLASVFMRSDILGWAGGGTAEAEFSNFRVLEGSAILIPEMSIVVPGFGLFAVLGVAMRRRVR